MQKYSGKSATHLSPIAADVISQIVTYDSEKVADEFLSYWTEINTAQHTHNEKRLFIDVLVPKVLKQKKRLAEIILERCSSKNDDYSLQFAILINKCVGRQFEDCSISLVAFQKLLKSNNIDLRLSTLAYIVTTKKITQPLTESVFNLIKDGLIVNFNLQRPFHRKLLENLLEHFLTRLNASWTEKYENFGKWLISTCLSELFPGASLPRIKTVLFIFGQIADLSNNNFVKFKRTIFSSDIGGQEGLEQKNLSRSS